ncbi:MAG TPA: hypothetical protein VEX37_04260 [Thermomicrobiales bacterium]|nr:hypothetical protein [Thermomicrobiales bacterium]
MASEKRVRAVKAAAEQDLMRRPGVNAVGIGRKITNGQPTDELVIVVWVDDKRDVPADQKIPDEIDGVKTDVVERKIVLH